MALHYFSIVTQDQPERLPKEAANPSGQTGFCDKTQKQKRTAISAMLNLSRRLISSSCFRRA
jgi:hypothetical protein